MNTNEFLALKKGNHIVNALTGSRGTVTDVSVDRRGNSYGVTVRWESSGDDSPGYEFTTATTAWMHWSCDDA
jgi:hypothetical protein